MFRCCVLLIMKCTLRFGAGTVHCFSGMYRLGGSADTVMPLIIYVSWVLKELKLFSVVFESYFA